LQLLQVLQAKVAADLVDNNSRTEAEPQTDNYTVEEAAADNKTGNNNNTVEEEQVDNMEKD
jgi:hypothetical protein